MDWVYWGEPFAKAYMETEGRHQALRIASGIKRAVEKMPVQISADHGIIGTSPARAIVSYQFGSGIHVDYDLAGTVLNCNPQASTAKEIQEIIAYFQAEDTSDKIQKTLTEEEKKCGSMRVFWAGGWGGHTLLDYRLVLQLGTTGLKQRIQKRMKKAENIPEQEWIESLWIICDALEIFAERYADAAHTLLETASHEGERKELAVIENICRKIPKYPAESWREALQAFWFVFAFDGIDSPGRFDQYMYPYLKKSLARGELTQSEAQTLLEKLWIRLEEVRAWNLCIGGQTSEGNDATNELSYMILDAAKKYGFQAPNLTMRCHKRTPDPLWEKAFEVIQTGIGMPALYNDDVVIRGLQRFGIPLEDARDYAMNGCNQIDIQGKSYMGLEDGELNLLKCLELALNRGRCRITGEMLGPDTGDPRQFERFEQVMHAYKTQVNYFTRMLTNAANKSQQVYASHAPNPFRSLLIADCLEKARDFRAGGPRYNHGQVLTEGIGNTADSLAAIKELVFEQKLLSMEQLLNALDRNFEGCEDIRELLISRSSHFGNDDDRVDVLAAEVVAHFFTELMKYQTFRGGIYGGGCSTFTRAPQFGKQVGATPDGRYALTPVADSSGAVQGRDISGPTAVLNSSAKIDQTLAQSGYVLNLKFNKTTLHTQDAAPKFISLVKTFFQKGGQQVQINAVSLEDLVSAQRNPEGYENLVVRVGGFSAYFVQLDKKLQNDIIARTTHSI